MIHETFTNKHGEQSIIIHLKTSEIIVVSETGRLETYVNMKQYLAEKTSLTSVVIPEKESGDA